MPTLIQNLQDLLAGPATPTTTEAMALRHAIEELTPVEMPLSCESQAVHEIITHFAASDSERTVYSQMYSGSEYQVEVKRVLA